jgi:transcriptional regulator with XRE-family HTH domain
METPGDRIKMLRQARGLTQEQLAQRMSDLGADITAEALSQWERGETKNYRPANLIAACEILETTPNYVWYGPSNESGRSKGRVQRADKARQK